MMQTQTDCRIGAAECHGFTFCMVDALHYAQWQLCCLLRLVLLSPCLFAVG
jgi:hypothetical protein